MSPKSINRASVYKIGKIRFNRHSIGRQLLCPQTYNLVDKVIRGGQLPVNSGSSTLD